MTTAPGPVDAGAAAEDVLAWMRVRDFRGHDPFDALLSPLAAPIRGLRWPAVAWIQVHKRSSFDLRRLTRPPSHVNSKALALVIQGLLDLDGGRGGPHREEAADLTRRLLDLEAPGGGWGYPFAWANRHFVAPAGTPSSVATAFVGQALLDAAEAGIEPSAVDEAARRAGRFLVEDLRRIPVGDGFLFSYTPVDDRGVHNASVLAAALLARMAARFGDLPTWRTAAAAAGAATLTAQRPDGSWPYGTTARDAFVDSFHTGYVLSALRRLHGLGVLDADAAIDQGLAYWRRVFLQEHGVAHRPGEPFPVDLHGVAQAILTCLEFEERWPDGPEHAGRLVRWAIDQARGDDGAFAYLWSPGRVNPIRYLRWVQAWIFRALTACSARSRGG